MNDPRTPIFNFLRPHLSDGWDDDLIAGMHVHLDALGATRAPAVIKPRPPETTVDLTFAQRQIDVHLLKIACPNNSLAALSLWVEPTRRACARWGIDTFREVASFLANISVESAGLTRLTESLNYSTEALINKFGRHRISVADAHRYGRNDAHPANQEAIANILYGGEFGRKQLGNIYPGDGWKFRGYGPKQITGRANQTRLAEALGIAVDEVPAYLRTHEGGMMGAGWFWKVNDLDAEAATPGVRDDRVAINGGTFGLAQVEDLFDELIEELLRRERLAA